MNYSTKVKQLQTIASCLENSYNIPALSRKHKYSIKFALCSIIVMLCLYSSTAMAAPIIEGTTLTATDITDALGATAAEKATITKLVITATTISGSYGSANTDWGKFKTLNTTGGYTSLSEIELSEVTTMPSGMAFIIGANGGGIMGNNGSWLKRFSAPKVTTIGTAAFYQCTGLEQVSFPAVKTIGNNAFQNCSKLSSTGLSFLEVTSLGTNAFNGCASLKNESINFPNITTITASAFRGCAALTEITTDMFPQVTAITGNYNFAGCTNLASATFENIVTTTSTYIFQGCSNLKIIIFPKLTAIVTNGFAGTTGLTAIEEDYFPNVESIGRAAFSSSTPAENNLVSVTFLKVTTLDGQAFGGGGAAQYHTKLTTLYFPSLKILQNDVYEPGPFAGCGITIIDDRNFPALETLEANAFYNCPNLQSVTLSNVTTLNSGAFNNCPNLRTITLPNITAIEDETFRDVKSVVNIDISAATSIGNEAFYGCSALLNLTAPALQTIGEGAFTECHSFNAISEALFPNLTSIGELAFFNCTGLMTASHSRLDDLGASAFFGCSKLASASFAALQSISSYTFYGCIALARVSFPEATNIASFAFANCNALTQTIGFTFPKVTTIEGSAFNGCQGLTELVGSNFPALTELNGFSDCVYLKTVNMPNIQTIKSTAFSGCIALESMFFENALNIEGDANNFPNGAFSGCVSLRTINDENLPAITEIGANAFYGCDMITSVNLEKVASIGSAAFSGCLSLATIEMPSLKTIAPATANNQAAFYSCNGLKDINLPSLEIVNGFANCANLESAYFEKAKEVGANAFANSPKLDSLGFGAYYGGVEFEENPVQTTIAATAFSDITTTNIGLALGSNLLPSPNVTNKTWPTSATTWKSINVETGVAQPELVFETITEAVNFRGNRSLTRKITITGQIQGTDYSASSEWSKFRTLNPSYPVLEEIVILTDQDIPNLSSSTSLFYNVQWLKKFSAPNVKSIGQYAFGNCISLLEANLPVATTIGSRAFYMCSSLSAINFPAASAINDYAFASSGLSDVNLPSLTTAGQGAFDNSTALSSMSFGTDFTEATTIEFPTISILTGIETQNIDLTLNQYVRPFPDFTNNTWNGYEWKSISIGNISTELTFTTVTEALDFAGYAHAVRKITITGLIEGTNYSESSDWSKLTTLNELYPALTELELRTAQAIPDCDTVVVDGKNTYRSLFYSYDGTDYTYNTWLKTFSAPNTETIGSYAFYHCNALETLNFANAKTVNTMAFASLNELASIPATAFPLLATIGNGAFSNCENVTEMNFPMVFTAHDNAFAGCSALDKIVLPKVTDISFGAFFECNALTNVSLGRDFMSPTEIRLDARTGLEEFASKTDLTLGYYVVPAPTPLPQADEPQVLRIWHTYTWQSINLVGKPDYPDLLYTVTLKTTPEKAGTTFLSNAGGRDIVSIRTTPANECYSFIGWANSQGTIISEDNPAIIELLRDTNLTAVYLQANVELQVTAGTGGTVEPEGTVTIPCGNDFVIAATADEGYIFRNWTNTATGLIISSQAVDTLTLEEYKANTLITANFAKEDVPPAEEYTVTLLANPADAGTLTGAGTYSENTSILVTATANEGYAFESWTDAAGTVVSEESEYTFTLTGDIALTANFTVALPTITSQPQSQEVAAGSEFTLSIVATGIGLQYQWQKDGADISGQTGASYTKTDVVSADSGSYVCVVSNTAGSVTSDTAVITVVQGIEEYVGGFSLSPNPSPDVVHIKLDVLQAGNLEISLIDLSGKEVISVYNSFVGVGAFAESISLSELPKSVYYLKVIHSGKSKVERIIHN